MAINIIPARRSRHLVQAEIIKALGGAESVAQACLLAPVTVRKWMEDSETGSGQDITVKNLQKLLRVAGQHISNLQLQNLVDELLNEHFLALCHRTAYVQDQNYAVMDILKNGHRSLV